MRHPLLSAERIPRVAGRRAGHAPCVVMYMYAIGCMHAARSLHRCHRKLARAGAPSMPSDVVGRGRASWPWGRAGSGRRSRASRRVCPWVGAACGGRAACVRSSSRSAGCGRSSARSGAEVKHAGSAGHGARCGAASAECGRDACAVRPLYKRVRARACIALVGITVRTREKEGCMRLLGGGPFPYLRLEETLCRV